MYMITDKSSGIRAVQRLLGINQNGIYDERTVESVKELQRESGLEVNGVVDYKTFVVLLKRHRENTSKEISGVSDGIGNFPYERGRGGDDVVQLHRYMSFLLSEYNYEYIHPKGRYFNADTEKAVAFLRNVFGLVEGSIIDKVLYARIKREIFASQDY